MPPRPHPRAPGYHNSLDHTYKPTVFELLDAMCETKLIFTESNAM